VTDKELNEQYTPKTDAFVYANEVLSRSKGFILLSVSVDNVFEPVHNLDEVDDSTRISLSAFSEAFTNVNYDMAMDQEIHKHVIIETADEDDEDEVNIG